MSSPRYAELQVTSHFSFLRGASSCDELFAQAALLGIEALAVVDRNSLAGVVRAHEAAKTTGVRLVVGCRLDFADGMSLLVYPKDRAAYGRLCRLLSLGKSRGGKGLCHLEWADVVAYGEGLIAVLLPDAADDNYAMQLRRLRDVFGTNAYVALTLRRRPNDQLRIHELANLATQMRVPSVVTNDVLFHHPARRVLQDVVSCIRHNITIDDAGFRRERHADRHLKPPEEIHRLFSHYPDALGRTVAIAEQCRFSLEELAYQYPEEKTMPGLTAQQALQKLTWEGATRRYPEGVPDKVVGLLKHELGLIETLRYAPCDRLATMTSLPLKENVSVNVTNTICTNLARIITTATKRPKWKGTSNQRLARSVRSIKRSRAATRGGALSLLIGSSPQST